MKIVANLTDLKGVYENGNTIIDLLDVMNSPILERQEGDDFK